MKAVILVGGEGTRLRPLTCNTPKAMVPVLNRPFLEHLLCYLRENGIKDIILAMSYLPDPIQSYFGNGNKLGIRITYVVEEAPLGTAGAVKNVESHLDGPVVVLNGDIITQIDLKMMIRRHQEIKPKVSIALTPVDNPTIYGVVDTDAEGMIKRFLEKPGWDEVTSNMINAGIYVLEPDVLQHIPDLTFTMFENYLFPLLLDIGEPLLSYPSDAYWIDIGTPEKYLKANQDLLSRQSSVNIPPGGESHIHPGARIEGPVLIGEGCVIAQDAHLRGPAVLGPGCEVAEGSIIERSVLWQKVRVGKGASLKNSIACAHSHVQDDSHVLDNCIVGDNATVASGFIIADGTKIEPDTHFRPSTN